MSIKRKEFYILFCDKCWGYLKGGKQIVVNDSASDLELMAVEKFGWLPVFEEWYCPQCQEKYNITWKDEDD